MHVSFIHCADLHLDSPMVGLSNLPKTLHKKLQESTFLAFKKIVDTAINKKVDFMIIAGDIYDGEDRSIRAQIRFRDEMLRLKETNIQVYLIHGNHDHLNGNWVHIKLPENVHVFPSKVSVKKYIKENITVNLYGFSYEKRYIRDRRIDQYHKLEDGNFHIGLLHGNLEGDVEHSAYAPFTIQDLLSKKMDYWALGHIHKRKILKDNPPIIYPGNIQGRHKKESEIKGSYYVELRESDSQIEFIPSSEIVWKYLLIDAKHVSNFDELYSTCQKTIAEFENDGYSFILSLEIENLLIEETFSITELLEILQHEILDADTFIWVREIKVHENVQWMKQNLRDESAFYEELFAITGDTTQVEQAIAPLYQHSSAHRFLQELSNEEKQEWMKEAEELLIKMLVNK
ncbi:metallophosphoesterase family protein [Bacillus sp. B1-b2]|uniref:metallophosphoesterase family protein n=1 Tax=Bacillus sp. B1-b2 TaxID=2653201 RepID=UPI0012625561|nr:DNA repair exonuclease [Bacillus sp. B1-b2]KAB7664130.1 DNA repair exonuclease [Bacillus sp. B1-b2]